jgi:hypothetical protein
VLGLTICFVALGGIGVAVATSRHGSDSHSLVFSPELGLRVTKEKALAAARSFPPNRDPKPGPAHEDQRGPPGRPHKSGQRARIIQHPQGFFSTSIIWPLTNEWHVASRRTFTAVDAGVDAADHSVGTFGIFRQNFVQVRQDEDLVKVPGAGALQITKAPLGRKVEVWAQKRGNLHFTSKNGVRGTLHLKDDSITLNR